MQRREIAETKRGQRNREDFGDAAPSCSVVYGPFGANDLAGAL